nr:sucrose transport protein SUC1-like [Arachis hypogaea]
MIDARCRDFLDNHASRDQPKIRLAYQFFSFFMAVRNELGYLAALFSRFDVMLAFTVTKACDRFCANMKSISTFPILLLPLLTAVALFCIQNKPALPEEESSETEKKDDRCALVKCFREMFQTLKRLNNMSSSSCLSLDSSSGNASLFWTQNTATAVNNGRRRIEKVDMLFTFAQNLSHNFVTVNSNIISNLLNKAAK